MKQRDTLEERMRGSGALLVALALLVAGSLLGLLLGVSDEHATAGKRREAREIASGGGDPDGLESARPARRYGDMDAMATGPNRAWPGAVSDQIAPPSSPPTYASQAELRALKGASLRKRAERRAYNGAPPTIPHPISDRDAASCVACHGDGLAMGTFAAPKMSHPFMVNCAQCHAPVSNSGPARDRGGIDDSANLFEGAAAPLEGSRAWPGAPPIIPHSLAMRGDCLSCHGPAGAPGIRTSHPERTNCQQCHAPPGALPDGSSASSRDGASGLSALRDFVQAGQEGWIAAVTRITRRELLTLSFWRVEPPRRATPSAAPAANERRRVAATRSPAAPPPAGRHRGGGVPGRLLALRRLRPSLSARRDLQSGRSLSRGGGHADPQSLPLRVPALRGSPVRRGLLHGRVARRTPDRDRDRLDLPRRLPRLPGIVLFRLPGAMSRRGRDRRDQRQADRRRGRLQRLRHLPFPLPRPRQRDPHSADAPTAERPRRRPGESHS